MNCNASDVSVYGVSGITVFWVLLAAFLLSVGLSILKEIWKRRQGTRVWLLHKGRVWFGFTFCRTCEGTATGCPICEGWGSPQLRDFANEMAGRGVPIPRDL